MNRIQNIIILLTILLTACTTPRTTLPTQQLLAAPQRIVISQDNVVQDCHGGQAASIHVTGKNVTVQNCIIIDSTAFAGAIVFDVGANDGKILNNTIDRAGRAGIVIHSQNNLIEDNKVTNSKPNRIGDDADGMRILNSNNTVRNNTCILTYSTDGVHADCIQGDYQNYQFYNIVIEGNYFVSPHAGVQVDGNFCGNVTIRNNTIVAERPLNMDCDNLIFSNNLVFGQGAGSTFIGIRGGFAVTFTGNTVCNTTEGIIVPSGVVTTGGNNWFYNVSGKAPRRDSGYSGNGTRWPSDKWQVFNEACINFGTGVSTPASPTATQTQITPTLTPSVTPSPFWSQTASVTPTITATFTATPSRTPTKTITPTPTIVCEQALNVWVCNRKP